MTHFHNSLRLPDTHQDELQAMKQDEAVYTYLKSMPNVRFTARRLQRERFTWMDINSVRRALTNLTTANKITHHADDYVAEVKGKPNTTYSYVEKGQLKLL